jgi:hypothetical protein
VSAHSRPTEMIEQDSSCQSIPEDGDPAVPPEHVPAGFDPQGAEQFVRTCRSSLARIATHFLSCETRLVLPTVAVLCQALLPGVGEFSLA